jgi:hypothetical protein
LTRFFLDTSALAKRYMNEAGSKWVRGWARPSAGNALMISDLAMVEMFSVIFRRQRMGTLSPNRASRIRSAFTRHLKTEYVGIAVDRAIFHGAQQLIRIYPLRTLDAIQLACALRAATLAPRKQMMFISSDINLLEAATSEGFPVDNPLNYP